MTRKRDHSPEVREERTIAELAAFSPDDWRDWFWDGVSLWFSVRDNEDGFVSSEPAGQIRREAFLPLILSARSQDPVGDLTTELRRAMRSRCASAARGVGLAIDDWQVAVDGAEGAAFIVALANALGTRQLVQRLIGLFQRPLAADHKARRRLIGVAVNAARDRGTVEAAEKLIRTMAKRGWMEAGAAARLLPKIAEGDLGRLARLTAEIVPALAHSDPASGEARSLARAMRYFEPWTSAADREPRIEGFAEALALVERLRPTASGGPIILPSAGAPQDKDELNQRTKLHTTNIKDRIALILSGNDYRKPGFRPRYTIAK